MEMSLWCPSSLLPLLILLSLHFQLAPCVPDPDGFFAQVPPIGAPGPLAGAIPALYVLGDSLVDSGNNNYLNTKAKADQPPYGIDFDGHPNGRFTNGRTTADFIAQLNALPYPPPFMGLSEAQKKSTRTGVNYASGSCGILPETGSVFGGCLSLDKQIDLLESTIKNDLPPQFDNSQQLTDHLSAALFFVHVGGNEFQISPATVLSADILAPYLVDELVKRVQRLYELGARKFLVANVGPVGCLATVFSLQDRCFQPINSAISKYNTVLMERIYELPSIFPGSTFVHLDGFQYISKLIDFPNEFGFESPSIPCFTSANPTTVCQNRSSHIYFDGVHPTQFIHFNVAKACFQDPSICTPLTLRQLLSHHA